LNAELIEDIRRLSKAKEFPDQTAYRSISVDAIRTLSHSSGYSGRAVEIAALEHDIVPERYARNMKTFSLQDQIKLLGSRVSIVGLGGLGGGVTEILARIGIGKLNLIDGDTFEDSNLNRQFLSTCDLLAAPKARAAFERVRQINPSLEVIQHTGFLTEENSVELLADSDLVVDCLDNLKTRFELELACKRIQSPLVSAAIAGSSGQVTTIFPEDNGFRLIYGDPERAPLKGAETALGTVPYSVTAVAALECAEVVKILLKRGTPLRNRLLIADLMDGTFDIVNLQ